MFLCHGQPVTDAFLDVYTNRNFDRVFLALERVQEYLSPLWTTVPDPFPADATELHPEISLGTIRRIRSFTSKGTG